MLESSTTKLQQTPTNGKLRLSSLTAGALIFISGGMNLAQSMGWSDIRVSYFVGHFHYCWFIAVIIGTALSMSLTNMLPKKFIMITSSILILAGGIMYTKAPNSFDALVAARYLNGIAVGLATVPFLMQASEVSRNRWRGASLGLEQFAVTLGIAIQMISIGQWNVLASFSTNCLHGILDIILAVLAVASLYYFVESPVVYIRLGNDAAALDSLPSDSAVESTARLQELTDYVREQDSYSLKECVKRSCLPLIKMIFFRSMMLAFIYNLPLTLALQYGMLMGGFQHAPLWAACLRVLGGCIALLLVDKLGRKLQSLLGALVVGALMVGAAVINSSGDNLGNAHKMETLAYICVSMQFFAGLFAPNTSVGMGEAFPLKAKSFCMALCVIVEQIIQIVLIKKSDSFGEDVSLMIMGIMILGAFVGFCLMVPETKRTSLKECQTRFANFFNLKMC